MTVPASSLRVHAYTKATSKLTTMEAEIRTTLEGHTDSAKEMTQQEALALQFKIQGFNIVVSTMATISKDLSDMIKSIMAKV